MAAFSSLEVVEFIRQSECGIKLGSAHLTTTLPANESKNKSM